ncbi:unnamed protein product [Calypogeia fissa]
MVSLAAHILGHAASHAARLKEEAYAVPIAMTYFTPLQLRFLGRFTRPWTGSFGPRRPFAWSGGRTPRSRWLRPFLGSGCRLRFRGLRPSRSSRGRRRSDLGRLGMFLSLIRR